MINITDVKRSPVAERKINSISIPNRNGEIFQGAYFGTKTIEVSFYMKYDYSPTYLDGLINASEFERVVQSLVYYLYANDAPAQLIFSDNPNQYYLAIVESFDMEKVLSIGQGTIIFKCFSPYTYDLTSNEFTSEDGIITIKNNGTANTYPIITTQLSKDTTHLSYISNNGIVQIGDPNAKYDYSDVNNPRIHVDQNTSTVNWYKGSSTLLYANRVIDENVSLVSDGWSLRTNINPTGEKDDKKYHGAFYLTNLKNTSAFYWKTQIDFTFGSRPSYGTAGNAPKQQGMIEFILYDANNKPLTNFSMRDYYNEYEHNIPFWYLGADTHVWSEKGTLGSIKTKNYTQYFDSLDDVPTDAKVIYETSYPKQKVTVKYDGTPIYANYNPYSKLLFKTGAGAEYEYAGQTVAGWMKIYLNASKTSIGWIANYHVELSDDGTHYLVTYSLPVDSGSGGNWNDFTGSLIIERVPHSNGTGSIWRMSLHKKIGVDSATSPITHSFYKNIFDPNNQYTDGGEIAKVGVYIASYQDAELPQRATIDDLIVWKINDNEAESMKYIGNAGDTIEVDMEKQMVYKNGIEFMEMVDVGSQFFDIPAFTAGQVKVVTDDDGATSSAKITKRYL